MPNDFSDGSASYASLIVDAAVYDTVASTSFGYVTSSPTGIACPGTCSSIFDAEGRLIAIRVDSNFKGWWSGAGCSSTSTCTMMKNSAQGMSATSGDIHWLSVSVIGSPGGRVTSSPSGINCDSRCSASFNAGTQVTLTASPATGLAGWSGGVCSGIASTCAVTMSVNASVSAIFTTPFSTVEAPVEEGPRGPLRPGFIGPIRK